MLVVKPIVARKHLVKQHRAGGKVDSRRRSPKQGTVLDLFEELVHFTRVFPHRRLTLEVPLSRSRNGATRATAAAAGVARTIIRSRTSGWSKS